MTPDEIKTYCPRVGDKVTVGEFRYTITDIVGTRIYYHMERGGKPWSNDVAGLLTFTRFVKLRATIIERGK